MAGDTVGQQHQAGGDAREHNVCVGDGCVRRVVANVCRVKCAMRCVYGEMMCEDTMLYGSEGSIGQPATASQNWGTKL